MAEYQKIEDSSAINYFFTGGKADLLEAIDGDIRRLRDRLDALSGDTTRMKRPDISYFEEAKEDHDIWASVNEEQKKAFVAYSFPTEDTNSGLVNADPRMWGFHLIGLYLDVRGALVHGSANVGSLVEQTGSQAIAGDTEGIKNGLTSAGASTGAAAVGDVKGLFDMSAGAGDALADRLLGPNPAPSPTERISQNLERLTEKLRTKAEEIDPVGAQAGPGILLIFELVAPAASSKLAGRVLPKGADVRLLDDLFDAPNSAAWRATPGQVGRFTRTKTPWGRNVWQRGDIEWSLKRPDGLTNLEAAQKGFSPLRRVGDGFEGVQLHHLNQDVNGGLAEVWASTHRRVNHNVPPPSWRVTDPDAAAAFLRERPSYWRWRAQQLLGE